MQLLLLLRIYIHVTRLHVTTLFLHAAVHELQLGCVRWKTGSRLGFTPFLASVVQMYYYLITSGNEVLYNFK